MAQQPRTIILYFQFYIKISGSQYFVTISCIATPLFNLFLDKCFWLLPDLMAHQKAEKTVLQYKNCDKLLRTDLLH